MYYARKREDGELEPVIDHLNKTAEKASEFAEKIGAEELGYITGMLHDIGKFSEAFLERLLNEGMKVDHSTAGAQEVCKSEIPGWLYMAYCIAGHHGGLPNAGSSSDTSDVGTLMGRLKRKGLPDYRNFANEVDIDKLKVKAIPKPLSNEPDGFSVSFFVRMLYSCLVDADFLATEEFMNHGEKRKSLSKPLADIYMKYQQHIEPFLSASGKLNQERTKILKECLEQGKGEKGLYSLTVATGGGKTIASMGFALEHLKKHKLNRVIYVIPYTSITYQTASVFRRIFGDDNVLEHHMRVEYDDSDELDSRKKLATENWNSQIIVTTNVQFFESLYSNRSSSCRKLHNIANSVIIFDEAQMFPIEYLKPCVRAIEELVVNYNCTAVLCTATQPALEKLFSDKIRIHEINSRWEEGKETFRRARFVLENQLENVELVERLLAVEQVLCIVNTKKHAQDIYEMLPETDENFHLSTFMTSRDIKRGIEVIRTRLKEGLPCRVISTSLIEAGVDVDFAEVYRAETGIDSELQAGGRCNREGKRPYESSVVHIFTPEDKYVKSAPESAKLMIEVQRITIRKYGEIESKEAIHSYFRKLYDYKDEGLDMKKILYQLKKSMTHFPFAEIAEQFTIIDSMTRPVIIPQDEMSTNLVKQLCYGKPSRELMRKINQYVVGVYEYQLQQLIADNAVEAFDGLDMFILKDCKRYDEKRGLIVEQKIGEGIFL